jgi:hypothetical protein
MSIQLRLDPEVVMPTLLRSCLRRHPSSEVFCHSTRQIDFEFARPNWGDKNEGSGLAPSESRNLLVQETRNAD